MPRKSRAASTTSTRRGTGRVTALRHSARDPSLVAIEIDGARVGSVLRDAIERLRLVEGAAIGAAARKRLDRAIERANARTLALRMLARSDRSAAFIERALVERHGISAEAAAATCTDLAADGWQDDGRYARDRSERLFEERKASRSLVVATLVEEGVDERLAERTVTRLAGQSSSRDELARAIACAEEALASRGGPDRPAKGARRDRATSAHTLRRIAAHLARRGYDEDTVATALDRLGLRVEND